MKKKSKKIEYLIIGLVLSLAIVPLLTSDAISDTNTSNELIILWQDDVSIEEKQELLSTYNNNFSIISEYENVMLITANDISIAKKLREHLSSKPSLCTVDYNLEIDLCSTKDPYTGTQWGLHNPGYYEELVGNNLVKVFSTNDVDMNMPDAWSLYNKDDMNTRKVVVAIIDTGVDNNHPDLVDSMWINDGEIPEDGIDNDNNGYIDDIFGWDFYNNDNTICHYEIDAKTDEISSSKDDCDDHGTHCAGIIAATANNNIGIAGVASNIDTRIMSLKIHGGPNGKGTIADAILAIKYATVMGADIVNMSWGSTTNNKALKQAISEAPMLFITAAGNTGDNNDKVPVYPASYGLPNVISVTFINQYGYLTSKSNYGKNSVDIAAPGMDIMSTSVGSYSTMSGSSMATPHITGLAAILYSCGDHVTPDSVKKLITQNVKTLVGLNELVKNPGIPDAHRIIQKLPYLKFDTSAPILDINTYYEKDKIMLGIYGKDEQGSGIRVIKYLSGKKSKSDFKNGTAGTSITSNSLELKKGGYYTFYVSDYSDNEKTVVYNVMDDKDPPLISSSYHYSLDASTITINLKVIDALSGVKTIKYTKGIRTEKDFATGYLGTFITLKNNSATIRLKDPGEYTFYATDYRGNKVVHVINIVKKPIRSITVPSNSINVSVGDLQKLKVTYSPQITTDKLYYSSSNPSIASVSQWGALHAKAKGRVIITITSTSGVSEKILVTVE